MNINILRIYLLAVFIIFPPILSSTSQEYSSDIPVIKNISYPNVFELTLEDKIWIEQTLSEMTLKEKAAQMIMPWVSGNYMNESSPEYMRIAKLVNENKVGGLIFFKGDILNEAVTINKLQKLAKVPLIISSDFEHGLAMRLIDATGFPYNMAVAATGEIELAYKMGKAIGIESRALGVHQNYAPVADINSNSENPIINIRSFSEDKDVVSAFCTSFIKGSIEGRMLSTAKHFPGHGNTKIDSHNEMPSIGGTRDKLYKVELDPFVKSIQAGVQAIMVGHLNVPAFENDNQIPASLSKNIVTGLLQDEMGFEGLVVTDAMNMNAVSKYYSAGQAAVLAVKAGIDIILMPPDEEAAINSIFDAVNSGEINEERIDLSVRKILSAKKWLNIINPYYPDLNEISLILANEQHIQLASEIAEKSITLVKNEANLIPLNNRRMQKMLTISLSDGVHNDGFYFDNIMSDELPFLTRINLNRKSKQKDFLEAFNAAKNADMIFLPSYVKVREYQGTVQLSKDQTDFVNRLLTLNKPVIMISFGNPYLLSLFPQAKTYICSYGDVQVSQKALADALLGNNDITGRLPISIPNTPFKIGDGIKVSVN